MALADLEPGRCLRNVFKRAGLNPACNGAEIGKAHARLPGGPCNFWREALERELLAGLLDTGVNACFECSDRWADEGRIALEWISLKCIWRFVRPLLPPLAFNDPFVSA